MSHAVPPRVSLIVFLCLALTSVSARLVNVTVDDSQADPMTGVEIVYNPSNAWSPGNCESCVAHPDPSQAFMNTWHDESYFPTAGVNNTPNLPSNLTFQFQGSALYVFCILAQTITNPDGHSDMSFILDENLVGTFHHSPSGSETYDFNVPVYVNTSIPYGLHSFALQNGRIGGNASLVLFDYYRYTYEDNQPNTHPAGLSTKVRSIIIGTSVAGGVLLIILISLLTVFWRRRYNSRSPSPPNIYAITTAEGLSHPSGGQERQMSTRKHRERLLQSTNLTQQSLHTIDLVGSSDPASHNERDPTAAVVQTHTSNSSSLPFTGSSRRHEYGQRGLSGDVSMPNHPSPPTPVLSRHTPLSSHEALLLHPRMTENGAVASASNLSNIVGETWRDLSATRRTSFNMSQLSISEDSPPAYEAARDSSRPNY